jgi:putative membrane protein
MDGGMMQEPWFWMFLRMFFWTLILVGIVLLVIGTVQKATATDRREHDETSIETLKKRYARGEITQEKFEKIKKDIV